MGLWWGRKSSQVKAPQGLMVEVLFVSGALLRPIRVKGQLLSPVCSRRRSWPLSFWFCGMRGAQFQVFLVIQPGHQAILLFSVILVSPRSLCTDWEGIRTWSGVIQWFSITEAACSDVPSHGYLFYGSFDVIFCRFVSSRIWFKIVVYVKHVEFRPPSSSSTVGRIHLTFFLPFFISFRSRGKKFYAFLSKEVSFFPKGFTGERQKYMWSFIFSEFFQPFSLFIDNTILFFL